MRVIDMPAKGLQRFSFRGCDDDEGGEELRTIHSKPHVEWVGIGVGTIVDTLDDTFRVIDVIVQTLCFRC